MNMFDRFDRHARLVERMADTLGVDLAEELMRGRVMPSDLRSNVVRCMGCERTQECGVWLEAHPDGARMAPNFCRNKEQLERAASH